MIPVEEVVGVVVVEEGEECRDGSAVRTASRRLLAGASPACIGDVKISDREREVIVLLCCGLKERSIAHRLGLASHTIHTHITTIHRKFQVSCRARMISMALCLGVVTLEEIYDGLNQTGYCSDEE